MLPFRWIYLNRELMSLAITAGVSLLLFFNNDTPEMRGAQAIIADVNKIISSPQRVYFDLLAVRRENEVLAESVTRLQLLNSKLLRYQYEHDRLRSMLNLVEDSPVNLLPASVINQQLSASVRSITINVGSEQGVVVDQAIMDINGLLGKTIAVGVGASRVQLITDINYLVSVRVGDQRHLGIYKYSDTTRGEVENIPRSADVEEGDLVVTSGISEIYPPDIPLARVISTSRSADSPFQKIIVELLADITDLNYVFVLSQ